MSQTLSIHPSNFTDCMQGCRTSRPSKLLSETAMLKMPTIWYTKSSQQKFCRSFNKEISIHGTDKTQTRDTSCSSYQPGKLGFPQVIRWLDGQDLNILDPAHYDPESHISGWCILHVLAQRFAIPELADKAFEQYRICRSPYWQGTWLPRRQRLNTSTNMQPTQFK